MKLYHSFSAAVLTAMLAGCSGLPSLSGVVQQFTEQKAEPAASAESAAPAAAEPQPQTAEPAPAGDAVDAAPVTAAAPPQSPPATTTAKPAAAAAAPQAPAPPAAPSEEVQQKRRLRDQLMNAKAKVATAAEAYAEIKRQSQTQGFSPSPDITRAMRRAELALESAEKEIEAGEVTEAATSLKIGEASADAVLRAAGSQ